MNDNVIKIEEYKKKIDLQEKQIARQSFVIHDLKDVIDRMNEDIENLKRIIHKQAEKTTSEAIDGMPFKD
jgi:molecular chaperone GrpE (heat shock protein)